MSNRAQKLLNLVSAFEKMAIDIKQPLNFEDDWEKWKEMSNPKPADDEDAYQQWLKSWETEEDPVEKVTRLNQENDEALAPKKDPESFEDEELGADTYIRTATRFEELANQFLAKAKKK